MNETSNANLSFQSRNKSLDHEIASRINTTILKQISKLAPCLPLGFKMGYRACEKIESRAADKMKKVQDDCSFPPKYIILFITLQSQTSLF